MNLLRCLGNCLLLRGPGMDVMDPSGRHRRGQGRGQKRGEGGSDCRERRPGKSIDRFFARGARGGLGAQGTAAWHGRSPLNPDVIGPEFS